MTSDEHPTDRARQARASLDRSERPMTDGGERSRGSRTTSDLRADGGEAAEFFERALDHAGAGVAVYDDSGRFTYVNDAYAAVLGRSVDDLSGAPVWSVRSDLDADEFDTLWRDLELGETRTAETACPRPDDGEVPVEIRTSAFTADGDRYHVTTVTDVNERVRNREQCRRRDERLSELASVVSHDLRNPLNVAMGRLRLAKEEVDSEHLGHVEQSLACMESLIDDMLALTRSGGRVSEPRSVALDHAVEVAWNDAGTEAATLDVVGDLGTVRADEDRLLRLLESLFENAVEHGSTDGDGSATAEGGGADADVTVRVGRLGDGQSGFYVADDGPGIPAEEREQVFDHGYSTVDAANGFGLPIVEAVAEAHDWSVAITESESGGTRVAVGDVAVES